MLLAPRLLSVSIGRDEAQQAAREELSKAIYHRDDPSLTTRVLMWLWEQLQRGLEAASSAAPGGYVGLLGILILIILIVIAIRIRVGPVARSRGRGEPLLPARTLTAAEHRAAADRHASEQQWAEAVRERLRAVARELEERAILEPRPGRTADELASDGGRLLPAQAEQLRRASRTFDDIWYGGRPGTPDDDAVLRDMDERVRGARPTLAGSQR